MPNFHKIAYSSCQILFVVSAIGCVCVGLAIARPPSPHQTGVIADVGRWLVGYKGWIVGLTVAQSVAKGAIGWLSPLPKTWDAVKSALDQIQKKLFDTTLEGKHLHRVTLFKHQSLYPHPITYVCNLKYYLSRKQWYWSGWLVAVKRSAHTSQRTVAVWYAPDQANLAEGFASFIWNTGYVGSIEDLPSITSASSPAEVEQYAKGGLVSADIVRKRMTSGKTLGRSFYGIPVEVNKKPWGVVVIDSQLAKIPDKRHLDEVGQLIGVLIGNIIEGGMP